MKKQFEGGSIVIVSQKPLNSVRCIQLSTYELAKPYYNLRSHLNVDSKLSKKHTCSSFADLNMHNSHQEASFYGNALFGED